MTILPRLARVAGWLLPLALVAASPAPAEAPRDDVPWLYRGSDVPQDKEWQFGELGNGLRYAVRRNGVPPGQVSLRVVMDVGSLYETESERGYSHLLEHMVFRQSKYLGDGEAIRAWQRLGATFGSDTNAETSFTQTVYKIDLPEASPEKLDESFRLLSGMLTAPTLSAANLKADLPIVLAEMRDNAGAQGRVTETVLGTLYAGQPIARRQPIGTAEALNAATADSLRAYHRRWYRPDRTVIVAVGDADPQALAALADKWFGPWKASGAPAPQPSFGDPVAPADADPANPVGETAVQVEADLPRSLTYAVLRPWRPVNDTIVYNQGLMITAVGQAILNDRLERRARTGASFLAASVNQDDFARSADVTQVDIQPIGEDWRKSLSDVRAVIADALAEPPSQEEIDKATADMETAYQVFVEQRALLPGARLADDLVQAFNIRETIASPETVLAIFRQTKPLFTPQAVLEHTRALFKGTVTRAVLLTPKAGEADPAALRLALAEKVAPDATARLASAPVSFADLPPVGKPGEVAALSRTGVLDIEQVDFANGVRALVYPSASEPGRVGVKVRFGGGHAAFRAEDAPYIALGERALVASGQATLGAEEIDRIATGRKLGFEFSIDDTAFQFFADTRAADLQDQLWLFAAKLAMPRWDASPVERARAAARIEYDAYATSPQGVLERDLQYYLRGRDPRWRTPGPMDMAGVTPEGFRKVWERILSEGPIEVQVYGDIDRAATVEALRTTFGALPPRRAASLDLPRGAPGADGRPVILPHRGDPSQAAAMVAWNTGGGMEAIRESRQLYILADIFSNRLLDAIRERRGAAYAPQVVSEWPVDMVSGGVVRAMALVKPQDVALFQSTARQIAADLIAKPPSADEIARVTEPLRQMVTRAYSGSALFMFQLEGATRDPQRFAALRTLLRDYTETTPEAMQALAARYLAPGKAWDLTVLPEGPAGAVATR